MSATVFVNGEFVPREHAVISVEDRGFVFADAIYEVIKCYAGRPFRLKEHLDRLQVGAAAIKLSLPMPPEEMESVIYRLIQTNRIRGADASVFLQVSRGPGQRDHLFPSAAQMRCTIIISATRVPPLDPARYENGVKAITVPDKRWGMCNVKSVGLLVNVLAKQQAHDVGAQDAIFVRNGILVEGASANLFAVDDGELITHPEGPYILSGITRQTVLEIAEARKYRVRLEGPALDRLHQFDEAFLTGTGTEILPVVAIDGSPVGSGRRGPITTTIQEDFYSVTRGPRREFESSRAH